MVTRWFPLSTFAIEFWGVIVWSSLPVQVVADSETTSPRVVEQQKEDRRSPRMTAVRALAALTRGDDKEFASLSRSSPESKERLMLIQDRFRSWRKSRDKLIQFAKERYGDAGQSLFAELTDFGPFTYDNVEDYTVDGERGGSPIRVFKGRRSEGLLQGTLLGRMKVDGDRAVLLAAGCIAVDLIRDEETWFVQDIVPTSAGAIVIGGLGRGFELALKQLREAKEDLSLHEAVRLTLNCMLNSYLEESPAANPDAAPRSTPEPAKSDAARR